MLTCGFSINTILRDIKGPLVFNFEDILDMFTKASHSIPLINHAMHVTDM